MNAQIGAKRACADDMTRVGCLAALALLLTSCIGTGACDPYYLEPLSGQLQLDGNATLLKADASLMLSGPLGMAWQAAASDSSTAPLGLGTLTLEADDFGSLTLALPFPLVAGQSVSLGTGQRPTTPSYYVNYQFVPGPGAATAWLDACTPVHPNCQIFATESVQGMVVVQQSKPLVIRIDATFSDAAKSDAPTIGVNGILKFVVPPPTRECNYND
jgi:hypothetical protein